MESDVQTRPATPKVMYWIGWLLSAPPVFMLVMSATMKLTKNSQVVDGFSKMGYPAGAILPLGTVELLSVILYLIPQTSVLGAIIMTGYLGGAVDVHTRNGDVLSQFASPIVLGILAWGGLFLRDARIRALIPFRKKP